MFAGTDKHRVVDVVKDMAVFSGTNKQKTVDEVKDKAVMSHQLVIT